jgi:hypothetical protein
MEERGHPRRCRSTCRIASGHAAASSLDDLASVIQTVLALLEMFTVLG